MLQGSCGPWGWGIGTRAPNMVARRIGNANSRARDTYAPQAHRGALKT